MSGILLPAIELGFPRVGGSVAAGFESLVETFAETLALSHEHGGALHIRVAGIVVADLWGGEASAARSWQQDTPTVIFSCTKGLVAILIGELVREGRLDLDAPASAYWLSSPPAARIPFLSGGCCLTAPAFLPPAAISSSPTS